MQAVLEAIRKRRSTRAYLPGEIEDGKLREILKAAMFSPSSRGRRPWEFVVVKNDATRKALSEATPWAFFVKEAPLVIVVCYDVEKGKRFKEDSSICAEHISLEAVNQGLGSCFIQVADSEGPHGDPEEYVRQVLGIPAGLRVQCLIPVGYPAQELPEHSESEFDQSKVHFEKF
jgi:nitroreductase